MNRVLIVSPRMYETAVWRCGQVECEDVLCSVDDVDLITPRAAVRGASRVAKKMQRGVERLLGVTIDYIPQPEPIRLTHDYEILFIYAQKLRDIAAMSQVTDWKRRCAIKVCLIEELWVEDLLAWEYKLLPLLRDFDFIGVVFHGTVKLLARMTNRRCEWVPGGVDALRFYPAHPVPRSLDVFGMGRRSELTHQTLVELCEQRGWTYLFDTAAPRCVINGDHTGHRQQLAALCRRSRYFVANKARCGAHDKGSQEELGYRSYEGAAGGAVLIGDTPKNEELRKLFDWPDAHVHVPLDATDDAVQTIQQLENDPVRTARIRRDNVSNILRRHDWAYRWLAILQAINVNPHDKLERRLATLGELANARGMRFDTTAERQRHR